MSKNISIYERRQRGQRRLCDAVIPTSENINIYEQVTRYGLGAALIALSVFAGRIPLWFNLVATYTIFTAMIRWDPVYAIIDAVIVVIRQQSSKPGRNVASAVNVSISS